MRARPDITLVIDPPAGAACALPARIEPLRTADGAAIEVAPPCGGAWLRDPDGGLRPGDAATAAEAGLYYAA